MRRTAAWSVPQARPAGRGVRGGRRVRQGRVEHGDGGQCRRGASSPRGARRRGRSGAVGPRADRDARPPRVSGAPHTPDADRAPTVRPSSRRARSRHRARGGPACLALRRRGPDRRAAAIALAGRRRHLPRRHRLRGGGPRRCDRVTDGPAARGRLARRLVAVEPRMGAPAALGLGLGVLPHRRPDRTRRSAFRVPTSFHRCARAAGARVRRGPRHDRRGAVAPRLPLRGSRDDPRRPRRRGRDPLPRGETRSALRRTPGSSRGRRRRSAPPPTTSRPARARVD